MEKKAWSFYGRDSEKRQLEQILGRNRWFFLKISGRRRIGKTTLVQQVLNKSNLTKVLYIQIPDSDPAGVISAAYEFYHLFNIDRTRPSNLRLLAKDFSTLIRDGYIVIIDEFQYFNRKVLYEFNSLLQYEVDTLSADAGNVKGGLIVLGSIHTEMSAILEDRSAPLFNRITDQIELPHLDISSVLEIIREHTDGSPERLLFLWNLFEGVPKFYRDCYEQDVISLDRKILLQRMFFSSSAPLRTEADNWFLRELRGRTDLILKYVAQHPGCSSGDLREHTRRVDNENDKQVEAYIRVLIDRYQMIERLQPIFSHNNARRGRLYIRDNFLRTWLSALAIPSASINFRPIEHLLDEANKRLMEAEGHGFERLVWTLYEERSRKGLGDFPLTSRIHGFWDRAGTELDLVALNETDRIIRFGNCKRNPEKLVASLPIYDGHVNRFLESFPEYKSWKTEKVALTPMHSQESRMSAQENGCIAQDLVDLTLGL